uniref:Uncharacterized protein n=1 Tax=Anguilla anguilla TaxID=7936 RepID=A0A0E9PBK1_ANGAN
MPLCFQGPFVMGVLGRVTRLGFAQRLRSHCLLGVWL